MSQKEDQVVRWSDKPAGHLNRHDVYLRVCSERKGLQTGRELNEVPSRERVLGVLTEGSGDESFKGLKSNFHKVRNYLSLRA